MRNQGPVHAEPALRCAAHPEVETSLRCSRCGRPICPRCARSKKLPTYTLSPAHHVVAGAVGAGLALAAGFVWRMLLPTLYFSLLDFLLAAGAGLAIAELVSRAVNRRRGLALQVIAALSLTVAFFLAHTSSLEGAIFLILRAPLSLLALALGIFVAVGRLR